MTNIHPTAIIDPSAEIAEDVVIGPYTIVRGNTSIGAGTEIASHVVIDEHTSIGPDCRIFQYASVGAAPQDLKYKGEVTYLKVGRGTVIREFVTINRGTGVGGGITEVGAENFLMAYCHVAHDCKTGRRVILANNSTLAGHCELGDFSNIGGFTAIHQFVRVGAYAYIGGKSVVVKDIPPYVISAGDRATLHGLNKVGMRRSDFSEGTITELKRAYRLLFRIGLTLNEAIERVRAEVNQIPEVVAFIDFIQNSSRGITR
ncbi:acyl-ACP--UDP-N-acetylglucosamine O-acyltransferase [Desulfoluna spongiiphila]|uniref:Acyl-[acyl-carrier-protein]--UDP-N-acetylglucosamine O-acyltransferase n=1 Tax=Desulfoluna spongiiphila TaxID=419481 RepID=A0A1G5EMW9_9BACT|nr:acyl-ACP--UDP-N-acetylglucosamine O-acyltransferase [Desulfoluna spongiiphila]SCY28020.1 acyl-[acyl-carrier-protein]--UDP-N-acetylglucosamine O-acyltransferase [Desulfoluna spongiiphila]VVS91210.1 acyl-[acyl-carrier-protein]--udp-n-acetylglucosamine o-acyltransferase [Desulfoluna spongiiphila]